MNFASSLIVSDRVAKIIPGVQLGFGHDTKENRMCVVLHYPDPNENQNPMTSTIFVDYETWKGYEKNLNELVQFLAVEVWDVIRNYKES